MKLNEQEKGEEDPTKSKAFSNKIAAAMIGNSLEFYDFSLFGTFAGYFLLKI